MHKYIYIYTHTHTHTHIYTHTHIHIHTHTHTHTYIMAQSAGAVQNTIYILIQTYTHTHIYIYIMAQSAGAVQNTLTTSLQRGKTTGYDTEQSDGEASVMLELWGMPLLGSTPLLSSLPSPLWPEVVASSRVLSMGQIEVNCVLILNWIVWNRAVYMYEKEFIIK